MKGNETRGHLDYRHIALAVDSILSRQEAPDIDKVRLELGLSNSDYDKVIGYFLHIWEMRYTASHVDGNGGEQESDHEIPSSTDINEELLARTRKLEESLAMMRATFDATADSIFIINNEGKFVGYNEKFIKLFHFPEDILKTQDETDALNYALSQVQDPQELANVVTRKYQNPVSEFCGEMTFKDGRIVERYYQPQVVNGEVIGHVWSLRDVTLQRQSEENLRLRKRAIESSTNGILIVKNNKTNFKVIYANPAFLKITNFKLDNVLNKDLQEIFYDSDDTYRINTFKRTIQEGSSSVTELSLQRDVGEVIHCELTLSPVNNADGIADHYICTLIDVTDRKMLEEDLLYKATHDSLTQLPNRSLVLDRLSQAINYAERMNSHFVVFFIDIDNFKLVNDSIGHPAGDELLKEVAKRLNTKVRIIDTIGRLGGDEFFLISNFLESPSVAFSIASRLVDIFNDPFVVNGHELIVTASVGGCIYPDDGNEVETLLKKADIAMYSAKSTGKNTYRFYQVDMNKQLQDRLYVGSELRKALDTEAMFTVYQPIFDAKTEKIKAVEALVRFDFMRDKDLNLENVIKIAEESGLIFGMTEWVVKHSCVDIKMLNSKVNNELILTLNISRLLIQDERFFDRLIKIINRLSFSVNNLELEVTESAFVLSLERSEHLIKKLCDLGVTFVLDDFGKGYSSFSSLQKFPISKLKIDKSFIDKIETSSSERAIVKAIISMADSLGIDVVAEGVETKLQLEYLKELGCNQIQGYYFSKPLSINDLTKLCLKK